MTKLLSQQAPSLLLSQHTCVCRDKSRVCHDKTFDATKNILSHQMFCHDKHTSVVTKDMSCHNKHMFITTNMCLSRQNFCPNKNGTCGSFRQWSAGSSEEDTEVRQKLTKAGVSWAGDTFWLEITKFWKFPCIPEGRIKKKKRKRERRVTLVTQATTQGGMAETLGESCWFSDRRLPSKLQPSSCIPPSLMGSLLPWIPPRQLLTNFRLSIEQPSSLQHNSHISYYSSFASRHTSCCWPSGCPPSSLTPCNPIHTLLYCSLAFHHISYCEELQLPIRQPNSMDPTTPATDWGTPISSLSSSTPCNTIPTLVATVPLDPTMPADDWGPSISPLCNSLQQFQHWGLVHNHKIHLITKPK